MRNFIVALSIILPSLSFAQEVQIDMEKVRFDELLEQVLDAKNVDLVTQETVLEIYKKTRDKQVLAGFASAQIREKYKDIDSANLLRHIIAGEVKAGKISLKQANAILEFELQVR